MRVDIRRWADFIGCIVLLLFLALFLTFCTPQESNDNSVVNTSGVEEEQTLVDAALNDYGFEQMPYQLAGYSTLQDYWNDLLAKRAEASGVAEQAIEVYADVITEEQKQQLRDLEGKMVDAKSIEKYNAYLEEFNAVTVVCDEALAALIPEIVYSDSGDGGGGSGGYAGYSSSGSGLTKSGGVFYFNGRKETYYSQRVLPGGGLNIPGRYVHSDGTIRDADGYIVVAASDLPYGSTVDTSLGAGKVYDTGCSSGITDIYTDW